MNKKLAKEIFEAGINYGAEKYGSTAGHFGLKLESPDFNDFWQSRQADVTSSNFF